MTDRVIAHVGLYSTIAAVVALVLSPLLALSYFATVEGAPELERAVDFFTSREQAERALQAVLADEPSWAKRVWIETTEFDVSLQ